MSEREVVVGIDVAKASVEVLTLGGAGPEGEFGNDPEGHTALLARLPAGVLVVMEASGGYEAALALTAVLVLVDRRWWHPGGKAHFS